jgi:hypothetical protein
MCELREIRDCPLDGQLELHCVQTTLARKKMQLRIMAPLPHSAGVHWNALAGTHRPHR